MRSRQWPRSLPSRDTLYGTRKIKRRFPIVGEFSSKPSQFLSRSIYALAELEMSRSAFFSRVFRAMKAQKVHGHCISKSANLHLNGAAVRERNIDIHNLFYVTFAFRADRLCPVVVAVMWLNLSGKKTRIQKKCWIVYERNLERLLCSAYFFM